MSNEIPQDQLYIRSASVYRGPELLRTTDINLKAGELEDDCIQPVLGVERDTDLVEIDVMQLSGPPANIYVMLAWWPFEGGGYGAVGAHAQSKGSGEVRLRFDPKGYKVPAMFGIRALHAFETVEPKPAPEPDIYGDANLEAKYVVSKGVALLPTLPGLPGPSEAGRIEWRGALFDVRSVERHKDGWTAFVREVNDD